MYDIPEEDIAIIKQALFTRIRESEELACQGNPYWIERKLEAERVFWMLTDNSYYNDPEA